MENSLVTDAVIETEVCLSGQHSPITIIQVSDAERQLDLMEKVSLVYLLYDDLEIALQHLIQIQKGAVLEVITEWCIHANKTGYKWQDKLLEALTIIQNFCLINKLGYNKKEVCERFLPYNSETSLFIDLYKKKLYSICEKMTNDQMCQFLTHIKNDFNNKKLKYEEFPIPYMEMYLLHWTLIKYISPTNFSSLSQVFKTMEMYNEYESLTPKSKNYCKDKSNNNEDGPHSTTTSATPTSSFSHEYMLTNNYENYCYHIDSRWPGICLIINQETFYREPDPAFKKFSSQPFKLDKREGTIYDCNELRSTFEGLGYTIDIKNNLTHKGILEAVKGAVNKITDHSSLIICILSHGLEGKVFGVNSIPVNVSEIRAIMCEENVIHLRNKPKILILQSCQGTECQTVSDDDDESMATPSIQIFNTSNNYAMLSNVQEDSENNLQMDGISRPKTADLLLFWATVAGYGAVRDPLRGSWFIQTLCKHIQEKANEMHFEDICTLVKQEVIDKRWKTEAMLGAMVPIKESTFSRFFYLPSFKPPM